jgi:hypothetical protein
MRLNFHCCCSRHPGRKATHVRGGYVVCGECASDPALVGVAVPVTAPMFVALPGPILLQDDEKLPLITDGRLRAHGNIAPCGQVLADRQPVRGEAWRGLALRPLCGSTTAFAEADRANADWCAANSRRLARQTTRPLAIKSHA